MRSAIEPTISAQVIAANVIWKQTYTYSGITTPSENVSALVSGVMPARNALENPPTKAFMAPPSENARL